MSTQIPDIPGGLSGNTLIQTINDRLRMVQLGLASTAAATTPASSSVAAPASTSTSAPAATTTNTVMQCCTGGAAVKNASYTLASSDLGKLIVYAGSAAGTFTLPATPPSAKWDVFVENDGPGALTLAPNGRELDGLSAPLSIPVNQGLVVYTDGTNYFTERGMGSILLETNHTPNGSQAELDLVAGPGISLADDGTGDVTISVTGAILTPSTRYDVQAEIRGAPAGASAVLWLWVFDQPVTFASNWAGSFGSVSVDPTTAQTWTLQKNGLAIGTVGISTGGVVTFASTATLSFAAGDVLTLIGSASADTTLEDVALSLAGTRAASSTTPAVVSFAWLGKAGNSQIVFEYTFAQFANFPANFAGSVGTSLARAGGTATFLVTQNGSYVGSVVFSAAGVAPTFTTALGAALSFSPGDVLRVTGPATADPTLANFFVSLVGTVGSGSIIVPITASTFVPVPVTWPGTIPASQRLLLYAPDTGCYFPANFAGSYGSVRVNPASPWTATVYHNAVNVGSIAVSTGGVVTFSMTSSLQLIGDSDELIVEAPGTADASLSDLAVTLLGVRGGSTGTGGTGVGSAMTNPMTTAGDMIAAGAGGTPARLGIGADGQALTVINGAPAWQGAPCFSADDTGTMANVYIVTTPALTIVKYSTVIFQAANANTGASTLTVNGASYPLVKNGTVALASGDIPASKIMVARFDGTNFQI